MTELDLFLRFPYSCVIFQNDKIKYDIISPSHTEAKLASGYKLERQLPRALYYSTIKLEQLNYEYMKNLCFIHPIGWSDLGAKYFKNEHNYILDLRAYAQEPEC